MVTTYTYNADDEVTSTTVGLGRVAARNDNLSLRPRIGRLLQRLGQGLRRRFE